MVRGRTNSSGFPKIARFGENAQLDKLFGVHVGWLIGLVLVVIVYIYLKYTKQGYEISVVGESRATAQYAGMNYKKIVLRTMHFQVPSVVSQAWYRPAVRT